MLEMQFFEHGLKKITGLNQTHDLPDTSWQLFHIPWDECLQYLEDNLSEEKQDQKNVKQCLCLGRLIIPQEPFIQGGSDCPEVQSLTLSCISILTEKVPLTYTGTFDGKCAPLSHTQRGVTRSPFLIFYINNPFKCF